MKNSKTLKDGHGLPEYIAYCNIRSGIRPLLRASRFAVAVVRPPGSAAAAYQSAARFIVGSRRFESNRVVDFADERANAVMDLAIEAPLFTDADAIPDLVRMAVDLVVELEPPTFRQMKGVYRWRDGVTPTEQQAELILLLDDDVKRAVARPGRSVGRMLSQLVMRPRDRASQPPPVRPANDDIEFGLNLDRATGPRRTGACSSRPISLTGGTVAFHGATWTAPGWRRVPGFGVA